MKLFRPCVEFIATIDGLTQDCFPYPNKKKPPQWIRRPHDQTSNQPTIRRCPGILDYAGLGFIVPLWSDLRIKYDSSLLQLVPELSAPWAKASVHSKDQFSSTPLESLSYPYHKIIKLEAPWRIKLPRGYSSLLVDPIYSEKHSAITAFPGIVDHDIFHVANIFIGFNLYGRGDVVIPRGTPLYQVIPWKRAIFASSLRCETILDAREAFREGNLLGTFTKKYWHQFWQKK